MTYDAEKAWAGRWSAESIKRTWDAKVDSDWWHLDPSYRMIAEAAGLLGGGVLDIGCGGGVQLAALEEWAPGLGYAGVDIHPEMVAYCRKRWPAYRFVRADGRGMPFGDDEFGVAVVRHVVEHLPAGEVAAFLAEVRRTTRTGLLLLFFKPPGEREAFTFRKGLHANRYERGWFEERLEEAAPGCEVEGRVFVPRGGTNPARNDQELWTVRWEK